jgi:outer membrane receptor protein involved in Fe transport
MSGRKLSSVRLLAGLMAASSAMALLASPAAAQAGNDTRLNVVVVYANQREEDLQDVSMSAAALPTDQIESLFSGGEDVLALATRVPGLYAESSNGRVAPRFYIRGLGNTDFDLAASQPVSIIMDDVVMENVVLKSTPLFDLERVEVYRGPQGTLFGRNTTAGIVRFTSARPTEAFEAKAQGSLASFGTVTFDGAVSGALAPGVSARASVLFQHRNDWIDNTFIGGGDDDMGGYDETAGRLQFLFEPNDQLSVLLNAHTRNLVGTSAIFRANVITQGTSGLNANYDRDSVSYDGGGGNVQEYTGWGGSARVDYDFGEVTLTSITAYEQTEGFSRGDIDGSSGPYTFNFIGPYTYPELPFASDTQDGLDDLDQTTQELRLASNSGGPLNWQAGVFWFDSSFTITTVGPTGFPPATTLTHDNTSWAIFGQASYDVNDVFSIVAGLRYTDDDKDLTVVGAPANNRSVSDDHVSWDISGMYDLTSDFAVYARLADGFRGPSIQGRDVAFGAPPSVAQSETVLSGEVGWKWSSSDMRINGAVFAYEVEDIQLTAVGGAGNTVQLLNADKGKAVGFELDGEWAPTDNFVLTGGFAWTDTELDDSNLAVGICAQCTVLDPTVVLGGATRALINGNSFPNAPEFTADFTARYAMPWGDNGEFFVFTDWAWQGDTNLFLYESTEFQTDGQFEGGLKIGYARRDGSLEIAAFARNITDEDNIKGGIDFNNNTAFVNEPRIIGVSFKVNR